MDLGQFTQYGVAGIFIAATWKLYTDMRSDSLAREEKLMSHLEKVTDTLETIDKRLSTVEKFVEKEGE